MRCSICDDPKRGEIDQARITGSSIRQLAKRYRRSTATIQRHLKHIPDAARRALEVAEARGAAHGASTLDELNDLRAIGQRLLAKAEKKRDYRTAIAGLRELVRLAEVKARVLGDMPDPARIAAEVAGETLFRMAELYVARRQGRALTSAALPEAIVGIQPTTSEQVAEE